MNDLLPGTTADFWANQNQELRDYYLYDWGVPKHSDQQIFELLVLELFSSGLNWLMMLHKRANFARAFANYDLHVIAAMGDADFDRLMHDTSIVRNRMKIAATIANAKAVLQIKREYGSFAAYVWSFTDGEQIINRPTAAGQTPTQTELSKRVAKDLKRHGCQFVGPVITYNFLQAVGVIDDHIVPAS